MSNNAKIPWNTQKTPAKHVLRLFEKFSKIRFSAEKSGSRLKNVFSAQISNYAKIPWNTQKTQTEHVLYSFKDFFENPVLGSNIRFSAQMSNNAKNTLKLRKHQLNMFWGFLRIFWKSGSRLKNPVLGMKYAFCSNNLYIHYNDVIMGAMTSQITSLTIVYSTIYSGAGQRKHQRSPSLVFVQGIHRWIPAQIASDAENVSIWWRHHDLKHHEPSHIWRCKTLTMTNQS